MNPGFAQHIDPIFEHVLDFVEREHSSARLDPDPEDVKQEVIGLLEKVDGALSDSESWKLAKVALISWIDETLINCEWGGRTWWMQNLLEVDLSDSGFQSGNAAEEFYEKAEVAKNEDRKDALEVFYIAVMLGFRGVYRADGELPPNFSPTLKKWLKSTVNAIELHNERPDIPLTLTDRAGIAGALKGKYEFLGALVWFALLLPLCILIAVLRTFL